ncbi:MAG: OB-fold nucleic acid binding domain-containing protein [archaeon]
MTLLFTNFVNLRELKKIAIDERVIKKICLMLSFMGLLIIYIMEATSSVPYTPISEITKDNVGEYVKVCGLVDKKHVSTKGTLFFDLKDGLSVKVVIFNNQAELISKEYIENSIHLCLEGTVKLYEGDLEIIAEHLILDSREQ